jgi:hypothetical protein
LNPEPPRIGIGWKYKNQYSKFLVPPKPSRHINYKRIPVYGPPDRDGIIYQTRFPRPPGPFGGPTNPLFNVGPYGIIPPGSW